MIKENSIDKFQDNNLFRYLTKKIKVAFPEAEQKNILGCG